MLTKLNNLLLPLFTFFIICFLVIGFFNSYPKAQSNQANGVFCSKVAIVAQSSASTLKIITGSTNVATYLCGWDLSMVGAATANTFKMVKGTGTNCGTGTTDITAAWRTTVTVGAAFELTWGGYGVTLPPVPVNTDVCVTTTTVDRVDGIISYAQF